MAQLPPTFGQIAPNSYSSDWPHVLRPSYGIYLTVLIPQTRGSGHSVPARGAVGQE